MDQPPSGEQEPVIHEARALLARNEPEEAVQRLRLHLSTHPGMATEYMLLGMALSRTGEGLSSLQAFEQAVAMEPGNATAHYNLGQAYHGFRRYRDALAELERALELRPDYPAAARAASELRELVAVPPISGPPGIEAPPMPSEQPWPSPEAQPVDERPLVLRLLGAAWQLLWSPAQAFNGGLDRFFNTPGAVSAVVVFFLLGVGLAMATALSSTPHAAVRGIVLFMLASAVNVVVTAAAIATFNRETGGSSDIGSEFGSLALSFALIEATLSLVSAPLILVTGVTSSAGTVTILTYLIGFWKYGLAVALVMATTETELLTAIVVLAVARMAAQIVAAVPIYLYLKASGGFPM